MSAGKMAYQFNVRSDLCLQNVESKTVEESCLVVLTTAFNVERSDELETQTHTHTHTHTHSPYQQSLIITQQQSLTQCYNCVTIFSVD